MCNLIFQKFFAIDIWLPFVGSYTFQQSVGLLAYPVTFLVTDLISEIYGQKKANQVITAGLIASFFMVLMVSITNVMPSAVYGTGSLFTVESLAPDEKIDKSFPKMTKIEITDDSGEPLEFAYYEGQDISKPCDPSLPDFNLYLTDSGEIFYNSSKNISKYKLDNELNLSINGGSLNAGCGILTKIDSKLNGNVKNVYQKVFGLSGAAVFASMMAYLFAQYIDVRIFHFWKKLTNGRHLWLRNNASTIFSQFIDTATVLLLLCSFKVIPWENFWPFVANGFLFKVFFAAFDTPIIYLCCGYLRKKYDLDFGQTVTDKIEK